MSNICSHSLQTESTYIYIIDTKYLKKTSYSTLMLVLIKATLLTLHQMNTMYMYMTII